MKFANDDTVGPGTFIEAVRSCLETLGRWMGLRTTAARPVAYRRSVPVPVPVVLVSIDDIAKGSIKRRAMPEIEVRRRDVTIWNIDSGA